MHRLACSRLLSVGIYSRSMVQKSLLQPPWIQLFYRILSYFLVLLSGGGSDVGGHVLFLFIVQAAMKTLEWPEGVSKPEFMTREYGKTTGERASRVCYACSFELWTSFFADDCILLFQSRDDLIRGSSHIFAQLRKFG
jgi:hypothetical protein